MIRALRLHLQGYLVLALPLSGLGILLLLLGDTLSLPVLNAFGTLCNLAFITFILNNCIRPPVHLGQWMNIWRDGTSVRARKASYSLFLLFMLSFLLMVTSL